MPSMDDDQKRFQEGMQAETWQYFDAVAQELRRDLKEIAERVRSNTELIDALRSEFKEEFADLRAMFKWSDPEPRP